MEGEKKEFSFEIYHIIASMGTQEDGVVIYKNTQYCCRFYPHYVRLTASNF